MRRRRQRNVNAALAGGAAAGNQSNVAVAKLQTVKTVVTSIPPNHYGSNRRRKR